MPVVDQQVFTSTSREQVALDYYSLAFSRNQGVLSRLEQERLRNVCVGIPGMGSMGSHHLMTLARTGICHFRIADFKDFDVVNMAAHCGAEGPVMGRNKAEVMAEKVTRINPDANLTVFNEPISDSNVDAFLKGIHILIDGLDMFTPDTRRLLYHRAQRQGKYVILAAPAGFGAALQIFAPGGLSLDEFYGFRDEMSYEEKMLRFLVGLTPGGMHYRYMRKNSIDWTIRVMPTLSIACRLASALAATEAVNLLLRRKPVKAVPHYLHFDPYLRKLRKGYLWLGYRNPIQRLRYLYARLVLFRDIV